MPALSVEKTHSTSTEHENKTSGYSWKNTSAAGVNASVDNRPLLFCEAHRQLEDVFVLPIVIND